MADYSRKRWLAPLVLTLWLWGSVPFVRVISDWLRDHGLLRTCIGVAGIVVVLVFVCFVRRLTPPLSGLRWAMLTSLLGLTVLVMMTVVQRPEEGVHFLQIGLLAFLVWRALPQTRGALGWAVLAGTLVGAVEEAIQSVVPGRVCDWRDIGMSAAAAVLTGVALWVIQDAASFPPTSSPLDHGAGASATTRDRGRLISTVHDASQQDASDSQRHAPRGLWLDPPFFPRALAQAILHFAREVLQHIRGDKG
jgi:hypothetical protein